jgi:hypothetical protein
MTRCFFVALAGALALALCPGVATAQTASVRLDANALALQNVSGFTDQLNIGATIACPATGADAVAVSVTQVQPDGNTANGFGSAFLPFCGATEVVP